MRLFFLALLLANVALFAYAYVTRQQGETADRLRRLQVNPEKIKVLGQVRGAPAPSQPRPAVVAAPAAPAVCLEWGVFAGPAVARASEAIAKLGLPDAVVQRIVADSGGYWVYIPPLKTKADIDKNIAALKEAGITEFFVVQGQTKWRNAVSLGVFKREDSARSLVASVNKKGISSVTIGRLENFSKQIAYVFREPSQSTVARLAELQSEFPGSELKAVACAAPEAAGSS